MTRVGKILVLLAVSVLVTLAQGCLPRYTLNGASIDYAVYPPLQQLFENRMSDMIEQQTRLRVIDNVNSDLRMEGEITGYSLSPQAVGEDAYASQTRLTITVRVRYVNNRKPELSSDQTFSAYRDFSSSEMLTDVQDELCNQITKDLSDLIFNATLGNW